MSALVCGYCDETTDEPVLRYRPAPSSDDIQTFHPSCIQSMIEHGSCSGDDDGFDPQVVQ